MAGVFLSPRSCTKSNVGASVASSRATRSEKCLQFCHLVMDMAHARSINTFGRILTRSYYCCGIDLL